MKILVINGSPRGKSGNTEHLVQTFLAGAQEQGAEAEVVYLKDKEIKHCTGCFSCWIKTPGVCIHQDDMPELLVKLREADVLVLASPLYIYTFPGLMKDFLDRMLPMAQPFIDVQNGVCSHPRRYDDTKYQPIVVISNCGFIEQNHFSGLKETVRCCFRSDNRPVAGMITCAGGELLKVPGVREGMSWYLDAVRQAGREVMADHAISAETQATLDRPLMDDVELFCAMANASWESLGIERIGEAPKNDAPVVPPPSAIPLPLPVKVETVGDTVAGMTMAFNAAAAGDMRAIIQFAVTDETPGQYYLEIADGKCFAFAGKHPAPTATITTPTSVWMGIACGELNGATAFMTGKYKVTGDLRILMQFEKLFPRAG